MPILSDSVLVESRTARDDQLGDMPHQKAQTIIEKVKGLYFALWQGVGVATTEQMKEFYDVDIDAVESALRRYRGEFESDGLKTLKGKQLKDFKHASAAAAEASKISQLVTWTPRAAERRTCVNLGNPHLQLLFSHPTSEGFKGCPDLHRFIVSLAFRHGLERFRRRQGSQD